MMAPGELDATLHDLSGSNLVDRSRIDLLNHPQVRRLFPDPTAANRVVLETLAQYSYERGLTPRLMKLEELFAASTMMQ
jgi:hypothetical protein